MPIIEIHLLEGRTTGQKQRAATAITEAVVDSLGVRPESVRILITEHEVDGFYVAGLPRKAPPEAISNNGANSAKEHLA